MSITHGVEQVRCPCEPVSVVSEGRCQRQADLVGGAAGGVIEHPAIAHVLGDGTESVQNGVVMAPVSQCLGSQLAVVACRDRYIIEHRPARSCDDPYAAHPGQDPGEESDHQNSDQHRDAGRKSGQMACALEDLVELVGDPPAQRVKPGVLVVGAMELLLQPPAVSYTHLTLPTILRV